METSSRLEVEEDQTDTQVKQSKKQQVKDQEKVLKQFQSFATKLDRTPKAGEKAAEAKTSKPKSSKPKKQKSMSAKLRLKEKKGDK